MSPRQAWRAIQAALPRGRDHLQRHRQQLRDRQRLSLLRAGAASISRRACSARAAMASPRSSGRRSAIPTRPCVGFAGDGAFGISMNEMSSIGREQWPGITMVIFRNYQWGAEKRNSILWYDNNFVGTELDPDIELREDRARPAASRASSLETQAELTEALRNSPARSRRSGVTTFIEVISIRNSASPSAATR